MEKFSYKHKTRANIADLKRYYLGKEVVDCHGLHCGLVTSIHDGANGVILVKVEFRTLICLHRDYLVPDKYFTNIQDPVLKLIFSLKDFKRQIWKERSQDNDNTSYFGFQILATLKLKHCH